jgi:MFS family permease
VLLVGLIGQAIVAVPLALVDSVGTTVALFAVLNALSTLVRPATSALVPAAVGAERAARGYTTLATGTGFGWIAGPALGGLITGAVGSQTTLLLDAGTFALLGVGVSLVRARRPPGARAAREPGGGRREGGLRLLWRPPILRVALLVSAIATGCAVVDNVAAPYRFVNQLGTDDFGYGLYLALWGIGALIGVQVLPRLDARHHVTALVVGNVLVGLGIAGIGLAPTFGLALVASAGGGFGNGLVNVAQNALIAGHTPLAQHGQAFAAAGAVMQTAIGVGTAVAAPLVIALGAGDAMIAAGGLAAVAALLGLIVTVAQTARAAPTSQVSRY